MTLTETLKGWTEKARATIIFDSTVDEFTDDGLFNAVRGKANNAVVATTTTGDVFGVFYSVAVRRQDEWCSDPNVFAFSFESHGRCATPQRFGLKPETRERALVYLCRGDGCGWFMRFDTPFGWLGLGNERSDTWCWKLSCMFAGMQDTTLVTARGADPDEPTSFACTRLLVLHLL